MPNAKVERRFFPNGQLRWQAAIRDGKPIGIVKHWHENGTLKEECPCDDDGLEHGLVRTWSKEGRLLGESKWEHGTGIGKKWFDNDRLKSESYYSRGKLHGRKRMWMEDGVLMTISYYVNGKEVSKKKYLESCKKDSTLPRYENDESESEEQEVTGTYQKRITPASEWEQHQHNEFIRKFLVQPNRGEASHWLSGDDQRNIGELTHKDSVEFVKGGYKAGATKILAVEIEDETTNCLIIYLPPFGPKRKEVFEWNSKFAQEYGWDSYDDWGQEEIFVYFS